MALDSTTSTIVSVGNGPFGRYYIYTSPDGFQWTQNANPLGDPLQNMPAPIMWNEMFITFNATTIIYSTDGGFTWTGSNFDLSFWNLNSIQNVLATSKGFVTIANGFEENMLFSSSDGINWDRISTSNMPPALNRFYNIFSTDTLIGLDSRPFIWYSTDFGNTWVNSTRNVTYNQFNDNPEWIDNGDIILHLGSTFASQQISSMFTTPWNQYQPPSNFTQGVADAVVFQSNFVLQPPGQQTQYFFSTDAVNWVISDRGQGHGPLDSFIALDDTIVGVGPFGILYSISPKS